MKILQLVFPALLILNFAALSQSKSDTLYLAVENNDQGYAQRMINEDADINHVSTPGPGVKATPLIAAVKKGNIDMAKLLIENKADVNWKDHAGNTALFYAASTGSKDLVVLLLDIGAEAEKNAGGEETVYAAAIKSGNKDLVKYLDARTGNKMPAEKQEVR